MWQRLGASHITFNTESDSYWHRLPGAQVEARPGRADFASMDERIHDAARFWPRRPEPG